MSNVVHKCDTCGRDFTHQPKVRWSNQPGRPMPCPVLFCCDKCLEVPKSLITDFEISEGARRMQLLGRLIDFREQVKRGFFTTSRATQIALLEEVVEMMKQDLKTL